MSKEHKKINLIRMELWKDVYKVALKQDRFSHKADEKATEALSNFNYYFGLDRFE